MTQRFNNIREAVKTLATLNDKEWDAVSIFLDRKENIAKPEVRASTEQEVLSPKDKEKIIVGLLKNVGMPTNIKGYYYSKSAIRLVWEDPTLISNITKQLYPRIAKEFDTTSSRVERALRHAIEVAWERGDQEMICEVFGASIDQGRGRPTNGEAIAGFVEYIKVHMT